ncbi:MAG: beta-ketoacyl-ACP synthase II [Coriobacteriales bacterium]|nr:beta-ketoacyl-ACP synthase II [Coriobacteriales bacterium]
MRRVAVTGMGMVTPVGIGVEATWNALLAGRSGISKVTHFDASQHTTQISGYIPQFDASHVLDPKELRRVSRFQQMALVAADEALIDSGLEITDELAPRAGVIVGSGIGGLQMIEEQLAVLKERGPGRISPFLTPMMIIDLAAGHISIKYGLKGINYAPVSACATGSHAIGEAGAAIVRDDADVIIAGGVEAGITPLGLGAFCAARSLSTRNDDPARASRPFDAGRDGFVLAEGGAVLVLEEMEHARSRGARVYAELVGYGATADAYHITAPASDGNGAMRAMERALETAELAPCDVGYINAHGTSTDLGDIAETRAIKGVFGACAPPVSSTKSMTGHMIAAAGSAEAAFSILAIERGVLPPTINLDDPDPECDLDYVPNVAREAKIDVALSNSFGFGGHNATLLFKRA